MTKAKPTDEQYMPSTFRIAYIDHLGNVDVWTIRPYGMWWGGSAEYKDKCWFVRAMDLDEPGDVLDFRMDRMLIVNDLDSIEKMLKILEENRRMQE